MASSRFLTVLAIIGLATLSAVGFSLKSTGVEGKPRIVDARVVGEPYGPLVRRVPDLRSRTQAASAILQWRHQGEAALSRWVSPALELGRALELIETAQRALENAPNYDVLIALSAAYLHLAAERDDVQTAAQALDAASRALLLNPGRAEAWFNRGVALEYLGLASWSDPWTAYRRVDSTSNWSAEAGRRAVLLESNALSAPSGGTLRARVEYELMPMWADAVLRHDLSAAAAQVQAALPVVGELQSRFDEPLMSEYVNEISGLSDSERGEYAKAVAMVAGIRRALETGAPTASCARIHELRSVLGRHAVAAKLLDVQAGSCQYYLADYGEARRTLSGLAEWAASSGHDSLAGRAWLALAAVKVRAAGDGGGDDEYALALSALRASGEAGLFAAASAVWAEQLHEQGDVGSAWSLLRQAFENLPHVKNPLEEYSIFVAATSLARADGMIGLAWYFSGELRQLAERSRTPALIVDALAERALVLAALGLTTEATVALDDARRRVSAITDPEIRTVSEALLAEAEARTSVTTSPCAASESLERTLDSIGDRMQQRKPTLYRDLAAAFERCGRPEQARDAYRQGIEAFEGAVSAQRSRQRRVLHTDALWDLYARLARLEVVHFKNIEQSLQVVDAGRRVWLGGDRSPNVPNLMGAVKRRLGSASVLTYLVLQNESFVWVTTSASTECVRIPAGAERLKALLDHWSSLVAGGLPERDVSLELYSLLVAPVERATAGALTVVIPDGPLHSLPFGALWSGSGFLVERTAVWTASSFGDLAGLAPSLPGKGAPRALVIGNPTVKAGASGALPRLPNAEREAVEVAKMYPGATVLLGPDATRAAVLARFEDADVIHVAAHSVVDLSSPFESQIPLAGPGAALTVRDLLDLRASPRIVVLASCQSAAGRPSRGFGATSLARVLAGKVATASVGALWDLSDQYSPAMAAELHRGLADGVPVAAAVRRTQLAMLARRDEYSATRVWAAMVGVGDPDVALLTTTTGK